MLGDVRLFGDRGAVQSLVVEQVAVGVDVSPRREGPGLLPERLGLLRVVQVLADLAAAVLAVLAKQGLELFEQVRLGEKWQKWWLPSLSASAVAAFICSRSYR